MRMYKEQELARAVDDLSELRLHIVLKSGDRTSSCNDENTGRRMDSVRYLKNPLNLVNIM